MSQQQGRLSPPPGRLDRKTLMVSGAVLALLAVVAVGLQRELRLSPAPSSPVTPMTERVAEHTALSAADESYAAALWAIHSQVKQDAVRMTFAGLSYQMKDIKAADLRARVAPLTASFQQAQQRIAALQPSPGVLALHERYLAAVKRYEEASRLMARFTTDSNNEHWSRPRNSASWRPRTCCA